MQPRALFIAFATLLAFGPVQSVSGAPNYNKSCLAGIVTASGKDPVRMKARRLAREGWTSQVLAAHGAGFANVQNASIIHDDCANISRQNGSPMWQCTFSAKPCKVTPTDLKPYKPGIVPGN